MTEKNKPATQKKQKKEDSLKDIVALCKRRGFVYPGSDIYGGLSNTFDYGPYGVELMRNLKNEWWRAFVHNRSDVVGLDSSIILHPDVWVASGHAGSFNDPMVDCKNCKSRFRADQYVEEFVDEKMNAPSLEDLTQLFKEKGPELACPSCGKKGTFTEPRQFNLMFETQLGPGTEQKVYLRPETAQGIFINFKNIVDSCRVRIPFGVAQIGKSFRNEIVARQFVFRTREFEQLEMEFFCEPGSQREWFEYWCKFCVQWLEDLGVNSENLRLRPHDANELSFYSEQTSDIEYNFPFGWGEIWGIASRTDYDLSAHMKFLDESPDHTNKKLEYQDPNTNKKYIPYVVEPALGLNRLLLVVLCDAYDVENPGTKEERRILRLHPRLSPVKAGIFSLVKKDGLPEIADRIYEKLSRLFPVDLDHSGAIGKRYYRQDELGTPYGITVDYDTKDDDTVTVRERDTTKQERVKIDDLPGYLAQGLAR